MKQIYNQDLKNVQLHRCHFGVRRIPTGKHKSKILLATQGSGSRTHIRVGVSKKPLTGASRITSQLFDEVTVIEGIGWGYCDIEYISAQHPAHQGMGKDGIILIGECEPIHTKTHHFIPLKPAEKGKNERYTSTVIIFSMEYFEFLKKEN